MTLAIDGHVNWGGSGVANYGSPNFSTAGTDRLIVVVIQGEMVPPSARSVSSISDTAGLTWTKYTSTTGTSSGFGTNCQATCEIWWAHAAAQLTNDVITVHWSAAMDGTSFEAFGVSGVQNFTTPFDTNASLPAVASNLVNSGVTPSIGSLNVNDANAMVIAFYGTFRNNNPTTDVGGGWTAIDAYANFGNGISLWSMSRVDFKLTPGSNFTADMVGSEFGWQFIAAAISSVASGSTGTMTPTEATDVMAASGYPNPTGTMTPTEAKDILFMADPPSGPLAATDTRDTMSMAGYPASVGTLAATDTIDTVAIHAYPLGTLAATESKDTAAFAGWVIGLPITGQLRPVESKDRFAGSNIAAITGVMSATESVDRHASSGYELPFGSPPAPPRRRVQIVT